MQILVQQTLDTVRPNKLPWCSYMSDTELPSKNATADSALILAFCGSIYKMYGKATE
jgi:hypothetical protein